MSGSTVSITGNQNSTARRRVVEKTQPTVDSVGASEKSTKVNAGNADAPSLKAPSQAQTRKSGSSRKTTKPRWLIITSILTKNLALLIVLLGLAQMIRWVVFNSARDTDGISVISGDFEGKFVEMEKFVKTTMKAMQVQVNAVDKKVDDGISLVRKEFDEKMEKKGGELDLKVKALDVRSDAFEKFINEFSTKNFLSKEEFGEFFEEFKKERKNKGLDGGEVSLDEIMDYARNIVEKEIEKHAADGLGMVDYALASGGARVVKHSEPYGYVKKGVSVSWFSNMYGVIIGAEKMINPSFGEPGHCFPLIGASGFVEIKLRTAIIPEAVTLEHVAKSVAYDRSSAPKQCRVSGWLQGQDSTDVEVESKMFLLTEFTYDLDKSNAQTFKVVDSASSNLVDTIRLDIASNHGSVSHTCIYRLRVHGHDPIPIQI